MRNVYTKFALDLLIWLGLSPVAFFIRLEQIPTLTGYMDEMGLFLAVGLVGKSAIIYGFGFQRQSWRRVGILDLGTLVAGIALAMVGMVVANIFIGAPRSIPIIEAALAVIALGGIRVLSRMMHERKVGREDTPTTPRARRQVKRVLIVGAGEAGTKMAREMLRHPGAKRQPVGFLDDDPGKKKTRFLGLPLLGTISDLPLVANQKDIDEVLLAIPSERAGLTRRVVMLAQQAGVRYRIIPGIHEVLQGQVSIAQMRDVDVEDLLRRDVVRLNEADIAQYIEGQTVLVTGAGGSIGAEIVRQVARFSPAKILLLGRGENSIYAIQKEAERVWAELPTEAIIADVRDRERMAWVFATYGPTVIFHAAAHKHVPLMEVHPDEAIFNNVGGTRNLVELALAHDIQRFVNISTDKAVNPTSIMGASKRVAELVVQHGAEQAKSSQCFVSVRFGNVLGSRGSVIPLFKDQIQRGGPVTVTHPEMTRYFMTIPEASQLVLQAGGLAQNGCVYVLNMGEPVRIVDLARDLIMLSGLQPEKDVKITYTGVRPGEKLYEELLTAEEGTTASRHEKIFIAKENKFANTDFDGLISTLFSAAMARESDKIRSILQQLIPTYTGAVSPAEKTELIP